jgi:hypothetical protein
MNLIEHREYFNKTFGRSLRITLNDVLDNTLTAVFKKPTIDYLKFDAKLHEKYGNYEDQGLSFNNVIKKNFGEEAVQKLEELFI